MFPFHGMPGWMQIIGGGFPLTHFLLMNQGIALNCADLTDIQLPLMAICLFTFVGHLQLCAISARWMSCC